MPATSKSQYKFMQMIINGEIKKEGLPKSKAKEYVDNVNYNKLPEFKKLKQLIRKK